MTIQDVVEQRFYEQRWVAVKADADNKGLVRELKSMLRAAGRAVDDHLISIRTRKSKGYMIGVLRVPGGSADDLEADREEVEANLTEDQIVDPDNVDQLPAAQAEFTPMVEQDPDAEPQTPPPPTRTVAEVNFGRATPPFHESQFHTADSGDHFFFSEAHNQWFPYEVPDPPEGPGQWQFNPASLQWEDTTPAPSSGQPPPAPNLTTHGKQCPQCSAQVLFGSNARYGICWQCKVRIDRDGNIMHNPSA